MATSTSKYAHGTPNLSLGDMAPLEEEEEEALREEERRRREKRMRRKRRRLVDAETELRSDLMELGMTSNAAKLREADYTKQVRT